MGPPAVFQGVFFNAEVFIETMKAAPMEFTDEAFERPVVIELPMPDGTFQRFATWEAPIMHPDLAARLPGVRTWAGQGIDDPTAVMRMDITPQGFHAKVLSAEGTFLIDPYSKGDTRFHVSYSSVDADDLPPGLFCRGVERADRLAPAQPPHRGGVRNSGLYLQRYRTVVAATGEYTQFHGGTQALAQAAIVTAMNRITLLFEREACIRFQLIANNMNVVYTNPTTDPYTNHDTLALIYENQSVVDTHIGPTQYDIGHVFSTAWGGRAFLAAACTAGLKAGGASGTPTPVGNGFELLVCHEFGHQFGAWHSFNGVNGSCGPNRHQHSSVEPGSGSTIMAYAGICGTDNIQTFASDYFVVKSYDEIIAYSTAGGGCPPDEQIRTQIPVVNAGPDHTIPRLTPFVLPAPSVAHLSGSPTYSWEQYDPGGPEGQGAVNGVIADIGYGPIIRSFPPTTEQARFIPRLNDLLNNTAILGETLPSTNRTLNFRCIVRDNQAGGGAVATDGIIVTVAQAAGPFRITSHNSGGTFSGTTAVTWDVAGTQAQPINCATVRIDLSTDGGLTWPIPLASNVANNGSRTVTLPSITTSTARLRVAAIGNIFFDVNDVNFSIVPPPAPPGPFTLTAPANGATGVSQTPVLTWTESSNAQSYQVTINTSASMNPPHTLQISTAATSYQVPLGVLFSTTQYYWRVVATNSSGSATGTPNPASFTTAAPPPPPGPFSITSPSNGATRLSHADTRLDRFERRRQVPRVDRQ